MDRTIFIRKRSKILKITTVALVTLMLFVSFILGIFLHSGLAGFFINPVTASILGLNQQMLLHSTDAEDYDIRLSLSAKGATRLIDSMLKEKDLLQDLQIEISPEDHFILSAQVDINQMMGILGESRSSIESSVGRLPDKVFVYIELSLDYTGKKSSVEELRLGKLKIPSLFYAAIGASIDKGIEDFFANALGLEINDIATADGKLQIEAKFKD